METRSKTLVNIKGDEMANIMWEMIKTHIVTRFYYDISIIDFDLSIKNRDKTNDDVTKSAADAIIENKIAVKCATITPNSHQKKIYNLKKQWKSPNATIRNVLNGTIIREPICIPGIPNTITHWNLPITICRHGYGDQYNATEIELKDNDYIEIYRTRNNKKEKIHEDHYLSGYQMVIQNNISSIQDFAHSCMKYAIEKKENLYLSTKHTVLKKYDEMFYNVFQETYENHYKDSFIANSISYSHKLIDDMVAFAVRSRGGFIWACKNYDGDVQSDFVAQGFGSLGMMKSILMARGGEIIQTEAAHGTVTKHYHMYKQNLPVSTNPIASIYAWTQALKYRYSQDKSKKNLHSVIENAVVSLVTQDNVFTKDIALLKGPSFSWVTTEKFIKDLQYKIETLLKK